MARRTPGTNPRLRRLVLFAANGKRVKLPGIVLLPLVALASAGISACSRAPRISIEGQEAKLSPALVGVCSVFLKIRNPGDGDDALIGARAELPGAVTQIHDIRDGKMVKSDRIRIPAGGAVEMRPGSLHLMVFHLPKDAGAGYEFNLRLVFEISGEKLTPVKISG